MIDRKRSIRLPRRAPLSAAIAAVSLALASPAMLADEHADNPQQQQTQSQSQPAGTAPDTGSTQAGSFTSLDSDGNGYLDQRELEQSTSARVSLERLDTDQDGRVNQTEFAAMESGAGLGSGSPQSDLPGSADETQADPRSSSPLPTQSDPSSSQEQSAAHQPSDQASSQDAVPASTATAGSSQDPAGGASDTPQSENAKAVAKISQEQDSLTTFTKALKESGIADALTDNTDYTLFAPTNQAFETRSGKSVEALLQPENHQELVSLLRAHIVADDVDEEMARNIKEARTIDGGTVTLASQDGTLKVGDASVVQSDIQQGSLRVYAIDGVLEPQSTAQTAAASSSSQGDAVTDSSSQGDAVMDSSSQGDAVTSSSDRGQDPSTGAPVATSGDQTTSSDAGDSGSDSTATGATAAQARFDDLDLDGDGYLSQEELQNAQGIADTATTGRLDANQDGRVSRTEFAAFEQTPESAVTSDPEAATTSPDRSEFEPDWEPDVGSPEKPGPDQQPDTQ